MNCMTENIAVQFQGLVAKLEEAHPSALCLVLTGHGNSFAAGADLNWLLNWKRPTRQLFVLY